MKLSFAKTATAVATAALLSFTLVGCGSDTPPSNDTGSGTPNTATPGAGTSESSGEGDYAFGTGRDDIATAIEAPYSSRNASATWEGDRLVVSMDGDINDTMAGFSECRVVTGLLLETDKASIKFPNGTAACEEVLDY